MKRKLLSRLVSTLSASALAVSGMGVLPAAPVSAASLTGQDAKGIVSKMTIGWNLGNTLDSYNDNLGINNAPSKFAKAWGNPEPTAEQFQAIKDGGFNTVRIPTTWYQHIQWDDSSKMYLVNDTWMDYVKSTVDYAIDRDMFVILNVHHEDWVNVDVFTDDTYKDAEKKLTDIWTQVAEEFKDYDQHLIFEGMNEPRQVNNPSVNQWGNGTEDNGYTSSYINKLNAAFVKTVRGNGSAANKERLLMLPGYCASSDPKAIRAIEIPAGAGNVALSVHAYAPYYFTMATDEKANHNFPGKSG
jgi:aryl-phospho-beta-D-glucosidase BglC (GH1 family)